MKGGGWWCWRVVKGGEGGGWWRVVERVGRGKRCEKDGWVEIGADGWSGQRGCLHAPSLRPVRLLLPFELGVPQLLG